MSKRELVQVRDTTYHSVPKTCQTCRHSNVSLDLCFLIKINGKRMFNKYTTSISPASVCDAWEARP